VTQPHWDIIEPRLAALDGLDDRLQQPQILALRPTFALIRQITVFVAVQFRSHRMTRSFVDTTEGHFFWHVSDLTNAGYSTPERVLSYLLHDAHHVRQRLNGDTDTQLNSLVRREVDATSVQLDFARVACVADPPFLRFLDDYRNDPEAIKRRLSTGVGILASILFGRPRHEEHLTIF
jgi:hypothetical protein